MTHFTVDMQVQGLAFLLSIQEPTHSKSAHSITNLIILVIFLNHSIQMPQRYKNRPRRVLTIHFFTPTYQLFYNPTISIRSLTMDLVLD